MSEWLAFWPLRARSVTAAWPTPSRLSYHTHLLHKDHAIPQFDSSKHMRKSKNIRNDGAAGSARDCNDPGPPWLLTRLLLSLARVTQLRIQTHVLVFGRHCRSLRTLSRGPCNPRVQLCSHSDTHAWFPASSYQPHVYTVFSLIWL